MQIYEVKDHEPSLLPDGRHFQLVWADEFDGDTLDTEKWDYRLSMMGKAHPAWTDKGVRVENGCAVFSVFREGDAIVSSQLQTGYNFMDQPVMTTKFGEDHLQWPIGKLKESKFLHRYGYYECCCRLQQMPGWWSAFWMQSPNIGSTLDPADSGTEVDIMECFSHGEIAPHNAFTGGYGLDMKRAKAGGINGIDMGTFHRFGLLWLPDRYEFYIDGVLDGVITEYVSQRPEFLLISTEVMGYRHKNHRPTEEAQRLPETGDTFLVDHVRVFDITEE